MLDASGSGRRPRADLPEESQESLKNPFASAKGSVTHRAPFGTADGETQRPSTLFMSQHSSLRAAAATGGKRNVLKRFERVAVLKTRNQWKEGDRITGLRKTKPPE